MEHLVTGKQRASRIPLDYYKHPDRMVQWKRRLTLIALIGTGVWIATVMIPGEKSVFGQQRFSHGAVAVAHKPIENDCSACHAGFGAFASKENVDKKCQLCHLPSPEDVHHANQKADMTPNCGRCHSDHHGLAFALTRTPDRDCVVCHKDLAAAKTGSGNREYAEKITAFAKDHPEFKVNDAEGKPVLLKEAKDPGKLKFNHKYHMTEGIALAAGGKQFTVEEITSGEQREHFSNGRKNTEAVKLKCANCHVTETSPDPENTPDIFLAESDREQWEKEIRNYYTEKNAARGRLPDDDHELYPPRKTGKYMKPIKYENNCAGCHPLSFDPKIEKSVEHGLLLESAKAGEPSVRSELTRVYTAEYEKNPKLLQPQSPAFVLLPGKRRDTEEPSPDLIPAKVNQAMRALLQGKRACGECHVGTNGKDLVFDLEKGTATHEIAKPNIPQVWLTHARFDHAAHDARGIDCRVCHKDAYASGEKDLLEAYALPHKGAEKVMIEGLDNCLQCHTPSPKPEFADRGLQARQDCAECHSYHQGEPTKGSARRKDSGFHAHQMRRPREELLPPLRR